jgi:hypothetical protein
MFRRARILLTSAAWVLATPVAAQTPTSTTTAFDGTYFGMSRTFEEATVPSHEGRTWTHFCLPYGPPATLTIVNGIARAGKSEGSVSPQGVLVMRDFWNHFDGRIDSQGIVRGRSTGPCAYQLVWQKAAAPTLPFDGDYIGVSRESSGIGCPPSAVPGTVIIRDGVALRQWQGTVSPQGILSLRTLYGTQVDGRIDSQGNMRGQGTSASGCTNIWVWRKQPG